MYSQTIAAAKPTPFHKPRFIRWPSICDTSRTNWLNPFAEPHPPAPVPAAETFSIDVGDHASSPPLQVSRSPPLILSAVASDQPAVKRYSDCHPAVETWDRTIDIGPWTLDTGPGIPATPLPKPPDEPKRKRKRRGRPTTFDEPARARFCGMIESGSTIRYAAKRLGLNRRTVRYACRNDLAFAERLRRAEQERDQAAIGRIHNAGEKSWRAAAWLLERIAPQEFSLRRGPASRSQPKKLAKRQFAQLVAAVAGQLAHPQPPPTTQSPDLPDPKPRRLTDEAIEAKIVELLEPMDSNDRFDLMYRLGY